MTIQPYHESTNLPVGLDEHERWLRVYADLVDLAQRLANSPFVPDAYRGDPAATFSVLLAGHGMGMHPIAALQAIDPIKGKPYVKTEVYLGLAYRAGHQVHWGDCTDKKATVRVVRGDGRGTAEITYTMAQAQVAGLTGKDNWRKQPAEMLRARAVRAALKMVAPDLLMGVEPSGDALTEPQERPSEASGVSVVQLPAPAPEPASDPPAAAIAAPVAEPAAPEPQPEPEPAGPELITSKQMRKMSAQIREVEQLDGRKLTREERRDFIRTLAGDEDLGSATELTVEQASRVIDELDRVISARFDTPPDAGGGDVVDGEIVPEEDGS